MGVALLCGVLGSVTSTSTVRADTLKETTEAEWTATVEMAIAQRVAALFYVRLKKLSPDFVMPEFVERPLREQYHFQAMQAVKRSQQLATMLAQLHQAEIPTIVLKGAFLAEHLYHDITLRPMSDVDLLVQQADLERAASVTKQLGYSLQKSEWGAKHLTLLTSNWFPLELHWHILNRADPFHLDVTDLWTRAQAITMSGQPAYTLSPEDLLLHLCLHTSFSHGFRVGLRAFCDIDATVAGYGETLDWDVVVQRAHEWGGAKAVFLTLYLAQDLLKTAVPPSVLSALQPVAWQEDIADAARQNVFNQTTDLPYVSTNFARMWSEKRPLKKAQIMWQSATLSPEIKQKEMARTEDDRQYDNGEGKNGRFRRYGDMGWRLLRRDEATKQEIALKNWLAE